MTNQPTQWKQNTPGNQTPVLDSERAALNNIGATMNANIILVLCSLFVELSAKKVQDLQIIVEVTLL